MALRRLSNTEMLHLSAPWVEAGPVRRLLESVSMVAAMLPRLDETHRILTQMQSPDDTRLIAITDEEARVDARHDALALGIYAALSACAALTADVVLAERILALQDLLFPEALAVIQKSYREEAVEAAELVTRLTPAALELLDQLPIPGGTLLAAVEEWIAVARRLGELEQLRAAELRRYKGPSSAQLRAARQQWVRVVHALVHNLYLAGVGVPEAQAILGPLRAAEKAAERRIARRGIPVAATDEK